MKRDRTTGRSRGEPEEIAPEVLAVRERELAVDGVPLTEARHDGHRAFEARTATNRLAGFTLGRLRLRGLHDSGDPGGISEDQFHAGERWARLVHQHAMIHGYALTTRSPGLVMVAGGISVAPEPGEDVVLGIRRRWSDCYNALVDVCKLYRTMRIRDVTYGVCVENWPISRLARSDYGHLRLGLNTVGKILS